MFKFNHRAFFSVVIPCYNSDERLGKLLQSIVDQKCPFDIEVILSDDCSTKNYDNIVKPFEDLLYIKKVKTDYNFSTNNTRQRGLENATGRWVTFADHDDMFEPDVFRKIKTSILLTGEKYEVITDFREIEPTTGYVIKEHINNRSWTHGNFFNMDNFIKKHDICYMKDLPSHEDIYFSCLTDCILYELGHFNCLHLSLFTYRWYKHEDSTTMNRERQRNFIEENLNDYIISVAYPHLREYNRNRISASYCFNVLVGCLGHCYFYMESFIYLYPDSYIKKNFEYIGALLKLMKKKFNVSNEYIANMYNDKNLYNTIWETSKNSCGEFELTHDIKTFLDLVDSKTKIVNK